MQMMSSMLTPQQRQMVSGFNNLSQEQQAEKIAQLCNQKGITKQQLAEYINKLV